MIHAVGVPISFTIRYPTPGLIEAATERMIEAATERTPALPSREWLISGLVHRIAVCGDAPGWDQFKAQREWLRTVVPYLTCELRIGGEMYWRGPLAILPFLPPGATVHPCDAEGRKMGKTRMFPFDPPLSVWSQESVRVSLEASAARAVTAALDVHIIALVGLARRAP